MVNYFECSFRKTAPPTLDINVPWPCVEPCTYPCEKGVWDWINNNLCSRLPEGGTIKLVPDPADPSLNCVEFIMDKEGARPLPANQHTKLYEVQGRHPENYVGVETTKEQYWNLNYWVPSSLTVKNWRLIWQRCGEAGIYGTPEHTYAPQNTLMFVAPQYGDGLYFYSNKYYEPDDVGRRWKLLDMADFPKNQWVSITVYIKQGSAFRIPDGTVKVWINDVLVLDRNDIPTDTYSGTPYVIWGIGNYGGGEELYGQTMFFKDIIVASERITTPTTPTPPYISLASFSLYSLAALLGVGAAFYGYKKLKKGK